MSTPDTGPAMAPPHHFSDIDVWKHPDRSYYLFITLSILFGFLGFDHFYLRSFGTGMQKFFINIFTFGLWYFWDLIQICFDGQKVRTEGLDSPFEWIRGIGRGVFIDPKEKLRMMADPATPITRTKKDIVIYALLTMMFGIFGFDKLYMGHPWQAVTKFISVFNILFFLFGLLWVVWDIVHVLFYPETLLKSGISAPLPFSLLVDPFETKGEFVPEQVTKEQLAYEAALFKQAWSMQSIRNSHFLIWNWDIWFWNWNVLRHGVGLPTPATPALPTIPVPPGVSVGSVPAMPGVSLPELPKMPNMPNMPKAPDVSSGVTAFRDDVFRPAYRELVVPVIQPTALTAMQSSKEHEKTVQAAGDFGKELLASVPKMATEVTAKINELSNPSIMMAKIQAQADAKTAERTAAMVGGALAAASSDTTGPIIAGTLSAIVLAGAGKAIVEMLSSKK